MINEKKGNLFNEINDFDVLIHGCNCFCSMGKGFALPVKERYPSAYTADKLTIKGDKSKLGKYSLGFHKEKDKTLTIINAYTQYRYGYGGPHFDMNAWKSVLKLIKLNFSGKRFVLPKIGSGLAGGDWLAIRKVLEEELGDEDVWVINID